MPKTGPRRRTSRTARSILPLVEASLDIEFAVRPEVRRHDVASKAFSAHRCETPDRARPHQIRMLGDKGGDQRQLSGVMDARVPAPADQARQEIVVPFGPPRGKGRSSSGPVAVCSRGFLDLQDRGPCRDLLKSCQVHLPAPARGTVTSPIGSLGLGEGTGHSVQCDRVRAMPGHQRNDEAAAFDILRWNNRHWLTPAFHCPGRSLSPGRRSTTSATSRRPAGARELDEDVYRAAAHEVKPVVARLRPCTGLQHQQRLCARPAAALSQCRGAWPVVIDPKDVRC